MSNPSRIFHFSKIREECRQQVYDSATILKMTTIQDVRHGLQVEDFVVGESTVFDLALEQQNLNPISRDQVKTVQIRESDPDYFWIIINMSWNQLED